MKCFTHPGADAVGSCKHCCKGICTQCATDTGIGVVCSANCAEEVKAIRAMVDRNKKAYPMVARTHSRNAVWFALLAVFMIVFGIAARPGFMSAYLIGFGALMFVGAAFSVFNSRRLADTTTVPAFNRHSISVRTAFSFLTSTQPKKRARRSVALNIRRSVRVRFIFRSAV